MSEASTTGDVNSKPVGQSLPCQGNNHTAPAVSVLMCVYKPVPEFFDRAVESILNQTFTDFEFIIVERLVETKNGRPGPDLAITAGELLKKYDDKRIVYVVREEPTDLVDQLNYGISLCKSNLIARMDADDICMPQRLEIQINYLKKNPDIDVLGTQLDYIDESGNLLKQRKFPLSHEQIYKAMRLYNPIGQNSVIIQKQPVVNVGNYQGIGKELLAEDYDLWCRLIENGAKFENLPQALVQYRQHSQTTKQRQAPETLRASIAIKKKYFSTQLGVKGKLRLWIERILLCLPAKLIVLLYFLQTGILFKMIFKKK